MSTNVLFLTLLFLDFSTPSQAVCNYISTGTKAYQLDTCYKVSTVGTGSSRKYECFRNTTTGLYEAAFLYWGNSSNCGASDATEPSYHGDVYDCNGEADDCYCDGDETDCDLATQITYAGEPNDCDETEYEGEIMVLGVCIPTHSETLISSRIMECAEGGSSLKTKIYSTLDCAGIHETEGMDEDTCYEVACDFESGTLRISILVSMMIVITCSMATL